jgi:hypothetical protein
MAGNRHANGGRQAYAAAARWARRRNRAVVTIRARRRDLARLRAEQAAAFSLVRCPQCDGTGQVADEPCGACSGKGMLSPLPQPSR